MRLDKYIAESMQLTRSEAKTLIKKGQVQVDGKPVKDPAVKIDEKSSQVLAAGQALAYEKYHYYMLHKPSGVVTAVSDKRDATVMELMNLGNKKLFPVGRLDKDTEGLLLITDDGNLAHQLLSPKKHVDKTYLATLDGPVTEEDIQSFAEGLDIGEDKLTMPALLKIQEPNEAQLGYNVYITIQEGKFHQVKRMAKAIGREVLYLKRLSMGPLQLDSTLEKGAYRPLTNEEIKALQENSHE